MFNKIVDYFDRRQGVIDIDCKNEDPERVLNLFIRAMTRLYANIAAVEYNGTNNKRDDYMRSDVETRICAPVIKGNLIRCNLWDSSSGASLLNNEWGEGDTGYDCYGEEYLWTFDHAFKSFLGRSGDIDFTAFTCVEGHCAMSKYEMFYTNNGRVYKADVTELYMRYLDDELSEESVGDEFCHMTRKIRI